MGQFKTEPKMKTTEPSVEKKMKKGGKADGGMMGRPMIPTAPMPTAALARNPRAMRNRPVLRKEGGESKATHAMEMHKMDKLEGELKSHESKRASKAHKGLKTGGVANAQGGYKTGGVANAQGGYKTGGVANAQGGYKAGGHVAMKGDSCGHTVNKKYGGSC
jgi:hypothetical protein